MGRIVMINGVKVELGKQPKFVQKIDTLIRGGYSLIELNRILKFASAL